MQNFLDRLYDVLMYVPLKLWSFMLDALASALESIPVPSFMNDLQGYANGIPADVIYYVKPFDLGTGIAIIGSAYLIRFLIRRIPFVG